ncbi:unnamed protein product [Paramecium primaurelia]|uniref:Major facilitator superfamily (MFS) profile domain-containing protein n=1 Tax=Paramecium primaurelia TaxID=5886 RepID=A0A8S1PLX8_PARPR|nr:unnamed protein product [Paramecium primaurelia]
MNPYKENAKLSLDQLIEKRCGTGRYQILALSILVFIDLNDGCELILMSFLMPILKTEWQLTSMQIQILTSIFYLGMVLGSILTGFVADRKGRLRCIYLSCIIQFFMANSFLLCTNFYHMIFARLGYGFVYGFSIPLTTTMISEITAPDVRGRFLIVINFFVSVGKIYAFLLAFLCLENFNQGHWRLMMSLSSTTSLIVGILAWIFLMESPRYLMASGQVVEGLNIIEEIIHKNQNNKGLISRLFKSVQPEVSSDPFKGSKYGYISAKERIAIEKWVTKVFRCENRGTLRELFNKNNKSTTIRLWIIWFCINFMYFGQLLILPFILGSKQKTFVDYLTTVLGEIPSIILSLLIVEIPFLGRRNTMAISFFCASIMHVWSYYASWPYFFARFFMKESWAMLYPYSTEIFHTSNRTLGFGSSAAVGRIGAAISPYILIPLFDQDTHLPFLAFAVSSVISLISAITLPYDTVGKSLDFQNSDGEVESNKEDEIKEIMMVLIEKKNQN